ncbi:MAG: response regulator [Candidatus Hydrogenedentes bacterium]|nr:response regulator [Candidatus Hydrogenedentota bacterium]
MSTVLIATIDSLLYEVLSSEISGEGHTVIWAADGKDAYDMTLSQHPDLVFTEEELPIFSGYELAEMLQGDPEVPSALPVYLLSNEAPEPHRFTRAGFKGRFPREHGYFELRELLAAELRQPLVWEGDGGF